jgi:hypothetical protein
MDNHRTRTCGDPRAGADYVTGGICLSGYHGQTAPDPERGYGPVSMSSYDTRAERFLHRMAEGGIFIDKRPAVREHGEHQVRTWVINDPVMRPGASDEGEGWLGYISPETYAQRWADRGARVSVREGDFMVGWDGTVTPIEPCRCWEGACFGCNRNRYYVDREPGGACGIVKVRVPTGPEDHCPDCKAKAAA